ncbi:MAG: NAD(P)/FAD-dependent oxidoreductase [Myxococcaceae bacterium]
MTEARWDDARHLWVVSTKQGESFTGRHLVLGVGGLHHPKFPNVPGRERFQGKQLHSAAWDESVDLTGQRVVVVGTGASAIQLVPALAPKVKQLTLFQRTPAWIVPRNDAPISGFWQWLYARFPALMKFARARIYARLESRAVAFKRAPWVMKLGERLSKRHLRSQVKDPALVERLTPKYAMGCKRVLISDEYYPAFNRENVTLESCAVAEVTERGVVTPDGRRIECDAIAWCTGFDVAASLHGTRVIGRGGVELGTAWGERMHAFRGTTIPGFPNLYTLMGPNTGLGHNSMVYMIESQIRFVLEHLRLLEREGATAIEVKPEVEAAYNAELQARMPGTVWASGCSSWYLDEKGRNVMLWPGCGRARRSPSAS